MRLVKISNSYGTRIPQPWISFGIHIDWQKKYVDLHFLWWIITIGNAYWNVITDTEKVRQWKILWEEYKTKSNILLGIEE